MTMLFVALLAASAAPAGASKTQESIFQDDRLLLESGADVRARTLDEIKALGADTIRVNAIWARIAPERDSTTKPNFNAADPAAYPADNWAALDNLLRDAAARGLGVYVTITGPAPAWASPCGDRRTCNPDTEEFKAFATALGTRYSGSYVPGGSAPPSGGGGGGGGGGLPIPELQAAQTTGGPALPRVGRWSIWNEPNLGAWLTPQYTGSSKKPVSASSRIYRGLLYAALDGLGASGHGSDPVMIGETAPIGRTSGSIDKRSRGPLSFYRDLMCIDSRGRALTGTNAKRQGCTGTFRKLPGAVAHHPYTRAAIGPPTTRGRGDEVPLASIGSLYRVLDLGAKRKRIASKAPVYLTEYGIETKPPNRFGVTLSAHALYLNQADWMAYRDGRIRSVSQYELVDPEDTSTFNMGLRLADGKAKPAFAAYRIPIWVSSKRVWGQVRAASGGNAEVQWRSSSKKGFKRYKTVALNSAGYFDLKVNRRGGQWRVVAGDSSSRTAGGY